MGKRSNKVRQIINEIRTPMLDAMGVEPAEIIDSKRDYLPTPYEAAAPLLPHLDPHIRFEEPCAGNGVLIDHLVRHGHFNTYACDIKPMRGDVFTFDAFKIERTEADYFITNPPWNREILHPLIVHLSDIAPTWLLFDADWMHTKQSAPFMERCEKIVSVGRVKWIPDSKMTGKDNCAWYLFDKPSDKPTEFFGRCL